MDFGRDERKRCSRLSPDVDGDEIERKNTMKIIRNCILKHNLIIFFILLKFIYLYIFLKLSLMGQKINSG